MVLISLRLKTIAGTDSIISVNDQIPLSHFREQIEAVTGIHRKQQRLIFRGHVLSDEKRSLVDYGFADGLAVHVVTMAPSQVAADSQTAPEGLGARQEPERANRETVQIVSHNLIVGQIPFVRTAIFGEPNEAMNVIERILEEVRGAFHIEAEHSLHLNRPHDGDFSINVRFRGIREQTVNSPARERFEAIKIEVKKLAWLVALIESQFLDRVDEISNQAESSSEFQNQSAMEKSYYAIRDILLAMHSFDHFDENALNMFIERHKDPELITLLRELETWQLPDDEAHIQNLNRYITVRHCLSADLNRLLVILSMLDAKITEHLMSRYNLLLSHNHNLRASSNAARLMNCFASAIARVQHNRAHIYHSISDLGVHVDGNGSNRLYPQFISYERDEPPQADISLMFYHPRETPASETVPTTRQHSMATTSNADSSNESHSTNHQNNTALNAMLSGLVSFAQNFWGNQQYTSSSHQNSSSFSSESSGPSTATSGSSMGSDPSSRTSGSSTGSYGTNSTSDSTNQTEGGTSLTDDLSRALTQNQVPRTIATFGRVPRSRTPMPLPRNTLNAQQHSVQRHMPVALGTLNFGWNQTSPEAPNAMFIGPRPPVALPLFTMDPFLACSSRRYRVFESDSRHSDFWNDPIAIRLGIRPPPDSIAAMEQNNNQQNRTTYNIPSNDNILSGRLFHPHPHVSVGQNTASQEFGPITDENSIFHLQANAHGEPIFTDLNDFGRFTHHMLNSIVRFMTQIDSSILPANANQSGNGFTANSRVSGFAPYIVPPPPVQLHMPAGDHPTLEGTITITAEIPAVAYRSQTQGSQAGQQQQPSNDDRSERN